MRGQWIGGYTLIELLIALSIILILATLGPSVGRAVNTNRQQTQIFELQRLNQLARSQAISSGKIITLCGTNDGSLCASDWTSPAVLVFDDSNNNHLLDTTEKIIYRSELTNSKWHWVGSNRPYLRYRPDGSPMEWGHFTLCPPTSSSTNATQIILNVVGRTYVKQQPMQNLAKSETCN